MRPFSKIYISCPHFITNKGRFALGSSYPQRVITAKSHALVEPSDTWTEGKIVSMSQPFLCNTQLHLSFITARHLGEILCYRHSRPIKKRCLEAGDWPAGF